MALAGRDGALSVDQALGVATLMVDNGELRQLIGGYGNWAEKTPAERLQVFEDFVRTLTFAEQSGNNEQQGILKTMIRNMNEGERGAMANSMDDYQRNGW